MGFASVLVVDDDAVTLVSIRVVLGNAGYAVDYASGGRKGLERIAADPPDLLITELLMPECDGIELIIAAKAAHPAMRIVAMTGRRIMSGLDLLDLATRLGADVILDKPIEADALLTTVKRLVGSAALD